MQLIPYLTFNGECEAAFRFYERTFDGKIVMMQAHAGTPAAEHVPAEWQNKIMHAHLSIGSQVLMGSDAPPGMYTKPGGFSVSLHIPELQRAERVFNALADGGTVKMPLTQTFWAERFGMVIDRFGTPWMVNCAPQS
jgi:PhnB protein